MKKIVYIFLISAIILVTIGILVWFNYAPIINNSMEELDCALLRYYDSEVDVYKEITLTEQDDLENIYNALKKAKLEKVIRFADSSSEPDTSWHLTLRFTDEEECFDASYYHKEYGIRKYIKRETGIRQEYILLSSEDVYGVIEKLIIEHEDD